MRIMIAGTGFIGSRLVQELQHEHEVCTISRTPMSNANQRECMNVYHSQGLWTDAHDQVPMKDINTIIYTASTANAVQVAHNPFDATRGMIDGPLKMMERLNPKHFIYFSSSMVYGDFNGLVPRETDPLNPTEPYGMMKCASEDMIKWYCNDRGIDCTIIRPSAVYGPRDKVQRVISKFIQAARDGKDLIVRGDPMLDLTYIDDLVEGTLLCLNSKAAHNETFNLTRGEAVPLFAAAAAVIHEVGSGQILHEEADTLYPVRGALDITKARTLLGYNPTTSYKQGIKKYWEWETTKP